LLKTLENEIYDIEISYNSGLSYKRQVYSMNLLWYFTKLPETISFWGFHTRQCEEAIKWRMWNKHKKTFWILAYQVLRNLPSMWSYSKSWKSNFDMYKQLIPTKRTKLIVDLPETDNFNKVLDSREQHVCQESKNK
jgi:hypothetical protein